EELDLNQTDFGALVGRKRDMIGNYEKGYPIPEKLLEAARYLRANPPPRPLDPASPGRGRPRGHANRPRSQGNGPWHASQPPPLEVLAAVATSRWFWIGLAAIIIALVIPWNRTGSRFIPDPDPVVA